MGVCKHDTPFCSVRSLLIIIHIHSVYLTNQPLRCVQMSVAT